MTNGNVYGANGISKKVHIAGLAITSIVGIAEDKTMAIYAIVAIVVIHSILQGILDWRKNGK